MNPFVERHQASISSTLSCFDRIVVTGTLPGICHSRAMASFLDYHKIRWFGFARWAEPLREELRENAERIAAEAGLQIEFIRKLKAFRKEARIKEILAERGDHPGLVHIFSAMESCPSYPASWACTTRLFHTGLGRLRRRSVPATGWGFALPSSDG